MMWLFWSLVLYMERNNKVSQGGLSVIGHWSGQCHQKTDQHSLTFKVAFAASIASQGAGKSKKTASTGSFSTTSPKPSLQTFRCCSVIWSSLWAWNSALQIKISLRSRQLLEAELTVPPDIALREIRKSIMCQSRQLSLLQNAKSFHFRSLFIVEWDYAQAQFARKTDLLLWLYFLVLSPRRNI